MGSFDYTCAISSFPIGCGEKVRFFALAQNPFHEEDNLNLYAGSLWQPICPPIKAVYNDYGSIENIEEGPVTDLFFSTLNSLAVEREVGENPCHDVEVKKGMPRSSWLEALWEGRVLVREASGVRLRELANLARDIEALVGKSTEPAPMPELVPMTGLQVHQTMIREDVYQALLGFPLGGTEEDYAAEDERGRFGVLDPMRYCRREEAHRDAFGEMVKVYRVMGVLRLQWHRGSASGPQLGEWGRHLLFQQALVDIAKAQAAATSD